MHIIVKVAVLKNKSIKKETRIIMNAMDRDRLCTNHIIIKKQKNIVILIHGLKTK